MKAARIKRSITTTLLRCNCCFNWTVEVVELLCLNYIVILKFRKVSYIENICIYNTLCNIQGKKIAMTMKGIQTAITSNAK